MFCNSRKFDFKDVRGSSSTICEIDDTKRIYSCFTRRRNYAMARASVSQEIESDEDEC